ncbi:gamma-tubulin complex component 4 [Achlya hypogyna]|uniref:Spindle pole body component n=1 Tax=Achlya hypogyna TaxID=1202772 RepID=A0A1V9YG28_ACHHY|nr:gamma-tubulin complex component 4 [Achlya hypogyna]
MHHEVFLALVGITGDVIVEDPAGGYTIDVNYCPDLLSSADRVILLHVLSVGHAYAQLAAFASPITPAPTIPGAHSLYRHALQHAVGTFLRAYERRVAELEVRVLDKKSTATLPLALLQVELATELDVFPFLLSLVQRARDLRGKDVLELVKAHEAQGVPSLQACARTLLAALHRVLYRQMMSWMVSGTAVVDPYDEFFIVADAGGFSLALARAPLRYLPATICEDVLFVGRALRTIADAAPTAALQLQTQITALLQAPPLVWDAFAVAAGVAALRADVARVLYAHVMDAATFVPALHRLKALFLGGDGALFNAFLEGATPLMLHPPHLRSEADLNHGLWAPLLRSYADDATYPISVRVPVQSFDVRRFGTVAVLDDAVVATDADGLVCPGPAAGMAWWPHPQYVQGGSANATVAFSADAPMAHGLCVVFVDGDTLDACLPPTWTPTMGWTLSGPAPTLAVDVVLAADATAASLRLLQVRESETTVLFTAPVPVPLPPTGVWTLEVAFALAVPTLGGGPGVLVSIANAPPIAVLLPKRKDTTPLMLGLAMAPGTRIHRWAFATAPVADPWRYLGLELLEAPGQRYRQLLFPPALLRGYNDVFRVLFRLKRLLYALTRTPVPTHAASLARHEMTFVLHHLLQYLHVAVVEAAFEALLREVAATTDFDVVQRAHAAFVATIGRKCFVHATAVMAALDKVLESAWGFVREPTAMHTFPEHCRLLFTVLSQTHARELMAQLDFNGYVSSLIGDRRH